MCPFSFPARFPINFLRYHTSKKNSPHFISKVGRKFPGGGGHFPVGTTLRKNFLSVVRYVIFSVPLIFDEPMFSTVLGEYTLHNFIKFFL